MQEFESISASSYDPSALAAKLTAKAAEGWSVVAIVPTGGDVTAFLSRETGDADTSASAETPEAVVPDEEVAEEATAPEPTETEPEPEPEVSEPSGWAIAPEPATPTIPEPTPSYQPTTTYQPEASPSSEPTPQSASAPDPPAAVPTPDPPAPTPAVPSGWYADPAGRFELRYWDGSTWTEHVSRAGQQFTDPPVA